MSKNKNPKFDPKKKPDSTRRPRTSVKTSSCQTTPSWSFQCLDFDGPWCPKQMVAEKLLNVIGRLKHFETMTWSEIEGPKNHSVSCESIVRDAQRRLQEINQDDVDELFSLRLSGKERVWSIRDGSVLKLLWWDPEHKVCPSEKKHT